MIKPGTKICPNCNKAMFNSSYLKESGYIENYHCLTQKPFPKCGMHYHDGTWRTDKEHNTWLES